MIVCIMIVQRNLLLGDFIQLFNTASCLPFFVSGVKIGVKVFERNVYSIKRIKKCISN